MKTILPIALMALLVGSCGQKFDEKVVVIEKTRSYHRPNCAQVMMARAVTASRTEARQKSYRPCPYCMPDQQQ
jgi:methylphosphotriester-DNA--protein-cysteine methyltransferase